MNDVLEKLIVLALCSVTCHVLHRVLFRHRAVILTGTPVHSWPATPTIRAVASDVLEHCQRGEPVSDRDAEALARAILNGAGVGAGSTSQKQRGDTCLGQ